MHLNLHTEKPRQLLIRACNCNVCTLNRQRESNFRLIKIMSKRKANTGGALARKCRPNFTGVEVKVLLQNVDVSILFHYGYAHVTEFCDYLFFHCHLQCLYSAFIYVMPRSLNHDYKCLT